MIGSLCSGIGGLDDACSQVFGIPVAWQSDFEPNAEEVLALRYPQAIQLGDLTAVSFSDVAPVEVMCFGFPCTDISYAGKGAGIREGTRSGLFFDCWRAVRVVRPRYVVLENVPAIFTRRPGIDVVADQMARDGYDFRWVCLRAGDVGACHRRKRWFCVAVDRGRGGWPSADAENTKRQQPQQPPLLSTDGSAAESGEHHRETSADTDRIESERRRGSGSVGGTPSGFGGEIRDQWGGYPIGAGGGSLGDRLGFNWAEYEPAIRRHEIVLGRECPHPIDDEDRLSSRFVEWMMMYPDGWVSSLLSRNAALRCLGNSVVTPQAVTAISFLLGIETSHTHTHTRRRVVASFADADRARLEGHGREPVQFARQLPSPTSSELSLSLSPTYAEGEHGQRTERSGNGGRRSEAPIRDGGGIPLPTPTAWLGTHAKGKGYAKRWIDENRTGEVCDLIAYLDERNEP